MSIGERWKKRLEEAGARRKQAAKATQAAITEKRAEEIVANLRANLAKETRNHCLVMTIEDGESAVELDSLRNRQHSSSDPFLGAAKTVVEFCLQNWLDVYVWEEDFSMSGGSIGAEIWVTPHGVPFHQRG